MVIEPLIGVLEVDDDYLQFVIDGQDKVELFPESETRFFENAEGHTLVFFKGPDGRATHMVIDGQLKVPRR